MSVLTDIIPAKGRKYAYAAYALAILCLGAAQVGYASAGAGQPTWLTVALAVAAYVGGALGATAAANTGTDAAKHRAE